MSFAFLIVTLQYFEKSNIFRRFPRTNPYVISRGELYEKRISDDNQLFKSSSQQNVNESPPQISIKSPTIKNFETSIYIKPDGDSHFPSVKVFSTSAEANSMASSPSNSSILNQERFYHRLSLENTRNPNNVRDNGLDECKDTETFHNEIEKLRHCLDYYQKGCDAPNGSVNTINSKNDEFDYDQTSLPSDGDNKMKEIISR